MRTGVHLAHRRRGAHRGGVGPHALRQRRGVEPRAPRRAGVRLRRLLAAPVGPAPALARPCSPTDTRTLFIFMVYLLTSCKV